MDGQVNLFCALLHMHLNILFVDHGAGLRGLSGGTRETLQVYKTQTVSVIHTV